jgi:hypothetical protein
MSSAFYPQGMNSWNNRLPQGGYKTWKGKGIYSNPVGVTSSHIRPLTNNDNGNIFPTGFGLARPLKHYRRGTVIPVVLNPTSNPELLQIQYNINRAVKSSNGSSLGGGNGGTGLISQMIDTPGSFIVKDNSLTRNNDTNKIDNECKTCEGIGIVSDWYPINNLTEKPQPNVTNPLLCCNQQRKAIQRVLPASTLVKKNYYQTTYMYLYNRCQTFKQRQFNFISGTIDENILNIIKQYPFVSLKILEYAKPGSPLSLIYLYVAQCNPNSTIKVGVELDFINNVLNSLLQKNIISENEYNTLNNLNANSIQELVQILKSTLTPEHFNIALTYLYEVASYPYNGSVLSGPTNPKGCKRVYYKPNNPQFATQGGVSSSTRILKLNVDTITTNANSIKKANINLSKQKAPSCNNATYIGNPFFFSGQYQNKKICSKTTGDEYKNFVSIYQKSRGNYIGATLP